jgi:3-oxoacyl-(acyl-carrier-protein) synthase
LSRPARVEAAISNSFAFGGLNAVLAFRAVAE